MLQDARAQPQLLTGALSDEAPYQDGVQCCGGQIALLLAPLPAVPAVAVFGMGQIGFESARILTRHHLEMHLVGFHRERPTTGRLPVLSDARVRVHTRQAPVLPPSSC